MTNVEIRRAQPDDFEAIGKLMVSAYAALDGFPKPDQQPKYYHMLANIGQFCDVPSAYLLVAASGNKIIGGVVYFNDMQYYGSGGSATAERNAAGFRLLAVSLESRGLGIGKLLTVACIDKAKANGHAQLIIHSTKAMQTAWQMYENLGFKRSEDLDFMQGALPVFGFRLAL